jgi:hypothetical protein
MCRDLDGRAVDDAGVAFERVAQPVVVVGKQPARFVERGEQFECVVE